MTESSISPKLRLGIVDYGSGNFQSVLNAVEYLGVKPVIIMASADFKKADKIILPGVGAFKAAMQKLEKLDLIKPLYEEIFTRKKYYLGICLGMQILAALGTEFEEFPGLNVIPGKVVKIDTGNNRLKLPHIGWNKINICKKHPLFDNLPEQPAFYFVHSFHLLPDNPAAVLAQTEYGGKVTAAAGKDNIFGVQFHPEKSQRGGLELLANFLKM